MNIGTEAHVFLRTATANSLINAVKGAAANKENIRCIDLQHFLVRMLTTSLGRYIGFRTFEDFQQSLLNAFSGNIACNRRIFRLSGNLIDFIDIDNASFSLGNIKVRRLNQFEQAVFHIFPYIAGFSQTRRIGNSKGNVQKLGQRLCQQGLAATRRTDHDNV